MHTLLAHSTATPIPFDGSILSSVGRERNWFDGPAGRFVRTKAPSDCPPPGSASPGNPYCGHLGVLRQEDPTLERQRRYDFWFRHA